VTKRIPAFFAIDVEPDSSSPEIGEAPWTGFTAIAEFIDGLRPRLAERSGVDPHFSWCFRLDPVVERCFGRLDFVVHRHGAEVDRLVTQGDRLGIHVHPQRWDEDGGYVYSEHLDPGWAPHCVEVAAATFAQSFGEPPRVASMGGRFINERVVDTLVDVGVRVDLTVDPGLEAIEDDRTFGHHANAPCTDFRGHPRHPYRVSRERLGAVARSQEDARTLVEIPRSSYDYATVLAPFRRRLRTKLSRRGAPMPLMMWDVWPSATTFWDFVERAADESPIPYVALTARSDPADRPSNQRVRSILAALPNHRIAERLEFVDPLVLAGLPPGVPKKDSTPWTSATALVQPTHG
jgi:hypothetical protein